MAAGSGGVRKESKAERVERIKRAKDGLQVWQDIVRYSRLGWSAIEPEDLELFKWFGIYRQKPNEGHLMLRLRLGGLLMAHQAAVVADLIERYARGYADITVRQNIQLHWLTIEDIPTIFATLANVGITTVEACGDVPRTVVGCPVHGVDRQELIDARWVQQDVEQLYVGNPEFSNLPRKFKVSVSGCGIRCAQPEINDIGVAAVRRERAGGRSEIGFDISVGGGLSTVPRLATRLEAFLQPWQVRPVCGAIAAIFREHGNRSKRTAARMKFLVEQWGGERYLDELQDRLPFRLDRDVPPLPALPDERDHLGIHAQPQDGLHYLGLATRLGRITATQLREVADLAATHGDSTVRLTHNQNLILSGVPTAQVDAVARRAADVLLPADADVWQRNFVACTGAQFCNLAVTATKEAPGDPSPAEDALRRLQQELAGFRRFVRINYNGCPNSCGQHWVADIGLQGVLLKDPAGEPVEGALVTIGGQLGSASAFGRNIAVRLPLTAIPDALVRVFGYYDQHAAPDENFRLFCERVGDEPIAAQLRGESPPAAD
ncbi:MAG: hypothetical protein IT204_15705 [Fimbriimonadaceae bacterium]|nr:hypothetical protein [Fimbriimonadaceae bacterium]